MHNVFVYGSLKGKYPDSEPARLPGEHKLDHTGMFPRLVKSTEVNLIPGELIQVNDEQLKDLDEYEDHPNLYKREEKEVILDSGEMTTAWVYV